MRLPNILLSVSLIIAASLANAQQLKVIKDTVDYKLMEVETLSLDSLINLKDDIEMSNWHDTSKNKKYDSLILICNQIKKINRKAAKEEDVDYCLADSYYRIKQYDKAIEFSKTYLKVSAKKNIRKEREILFNKRLLCENLCEIYKERHDTLTALKYLLEIEKHYFFGWHYSSPKGWRGIEFYEEILELYVALHDEEGVAKYFEKIEALYKKMK